jgi:hypothetical protein
MASKEARDFLDKLNEGTAPADEMGDRPKMERVKSRRMTEVGTKEGFEEDVSADPKTAKTKDSLSATLASSNPLTSDVRIQSTTD